MAETNRNLKSSKVVEPTLVNGEKLSKVKLVECLLLLVPACASVFIAWKALNLSNSAEFRQQLAYFDQEKLSASKIYCENDGNGISARIKFHVDRASIAAKYLGENLSAADLQELVILGLVVWTPMECSPYANAALERANESGSDFDLCNAYRILGQVEFERLHQLGKKLQSPIDKTEMVGNFKKAIQHAINYKDASIGNRLHFDVLRCWARYERCLENLINAQHVESDKLFTSAQTLSLHITGYEKYAAYVEDEKTKIDNGSMLRPSCPSELLVRASFDSNKDFDNFAENDLEKKFQSGNVTQASAQDQETISKNGSNDDKEISSPQDELLSVAESGFRKIKLINTTNRRKIPIINGQRMKSIPAFDSRFYKVPLGEIEIGRLGSGKELIVDLSVLDPNALYLIELTPCCIVGELD